MKIQNYRAATIYASAAVLADFASSIMKKIEDHFVYRQIIPFFMSEKARLYYHLCIRAEIEEYILQYISKSAGTIDSSKSLGSTHKGRRGMWVPSHGIFILLRECWPQDEVAIEKNKLKEIIYFASTIFNNLKALLQYYLKILFNLVNRLLCRYDISLFDSSVSYIAVSYNEGVNLKSRSDIVWLNGSHIDKSRLLIIIDDARTLEWKSKCFYYLDKQTVCELNESGLKWVGIPTSGILMNMHEKGWAPRLRYELPEWLINIKRQKTDDIGKWIIKTSEKLIGEVQLWKNFYEAFHIKILFESGEGSAKYVAQGIAFDVFNKDKGITVGKQRSDIGETPKAMSGYYTKDVFFTWNRRFKDYMTPEFNNVESQIVTGYTNDSSFDEISDELINIQKQIKNNGVNFIIALFDTGCGNGVNRIPMNVIFDFYKYFLGWILEDESIGIVIKSKKPYILKSMPEILMLLETAKKTGRCVKLENELGRMPSDASKIADFAVGAGIATSVTEAVLAGCRGVRYLKGFPLWHDYYKWGYEKLVFDDLDRMMSALKSYKADKSSNPELGDWTPYLDLLDPFRDGRTGERMGTYLRWCLEGFDAGMDRNEVIRQANNKYADRWGNDKVIKSTDI